MAYPPGDEPRAAQGEDPVTVMAKAQLALHVMETGPELDEAVAAAEKVFARHRGEPPTVRGFLAMMTEVREAAGIWVHLDGTPRHHDDRFRGELFTADPARVTCPACRGSADG